MQPPQVEAVPAPGVTELAPTSVVLASSSDQEAPAPVTVDTRDKVSVLSQFGHSPIVCQTHPHPILKLDVSKRQAQTDTDKVSGWYTAPIIVTQDLDRAGHVSRRGSLPVSQLSGSLLAPARASNGLSNGLGSGIKAHSAESSPKRVSVSQYSSIAHKLPFPSQSLRRRSADPSELLGYRTNPGSQRTSPTGSSLASEDLGLLSLLALDQRRASGGSCLPLSPVWESGPGLARQYNMMTIREVMSLCGSTTSLASTQVTVQHSPDLPLSSPISFGLSPSNNTKTVFRYPQYFFMAATATRLARVKTFILCTNFTVFVFSSLSLASHSHTLN